MISRAPHLGLDALHVGAERSGQRQLHPNEAEALLDPPLLVADVPRHLVALEGQIHKGCLHEIAQLCSAEIDQPDSDRRRTCRGVFRARCGIYWTPASRPPKTKSDSDGLPDNHNGEISYSNNSSSLQAS